VDVLPDELAEAHRIAQVREAAKIEAALARLWTATIDPDDFDRTFALFRERALPLLQAGISRSQGVAGAYMDTLLDARGLPRGPRLPLEPGSSPYLRGRLAIGADAARTGYLLRTGDPATRSVVMEAALAGVLGESKRTILNAGRSRVEELGRRDTRRFARVSDGAPCSFCAMLVSRGPVYTVASGGFRAHSRCGCSIRPVLPGDPDRGWTPEARRLRAVWSEVAEGDPVAFRRVIEGRPLDSRLASATKYDVGLKNRLESFLAREAARPEYRARSFENLAVLIALLTLRTPTPAPLTA
jgi:hypothetical protein